MMEKAEPNIIIHVYVHDVSVSYIVQSTRGRGGGEGEACMQSNYESVI